MAYSVSQEATTYGGTRGPGWIADATVMQDGVPIATLETHHRGFGGPEYRVRVTALDGGAPFGFPVTSPEEATALRDHLIELGTGNRQEELQQFVVGLQQAAANRYRVTGDFNDYSVDDQPLNVADEVGQRFINGNYAGISPELREAALQYGDEIAGRTNTPDLDGIDGTSREERAAYALAVSMDLTVEGRNVVSTFDNHFSVLDNAKAAGNLNEETIAVARQILQDTYGIQLQNVESDQNFVSTVREGLEPSPSGRTR